MPGNFKLAQGRPCPYCKRSMEARHPSLQPTRDHIVPQSLGGKVIVICCIDCNTIKADLPPLLWSAFMLANPEWWRMPRSILRRQKRALIVAGAPADTPPLEIVPASRYRRQRQGEAPPAAVIVPPALIWNLQVPQPVEECLHAAFGVVADDPDVVGARSDGRLQDIALLDAALDPDDRQDDDHSIL